MEKIMNLLPNVSHKQKMFYNMLIAQVGFILLTSVMVFFNGDIMVAVSINIVFAILIAYLNWAACRRVEYGIEIFKKTDANDYGLFFYENKYH